MWPLLPAVIGAGVDLAGMLFQKHQADTAHQREVVDLQKAGINPLMTAQTRGSPVPDLPSFGADVQAGISSGLSLQRQPRELDRLSAVVAETAARARELGISADWMDTLKALQVKLMDRDLTLKDLDIQQLRLIQPIALDQARAELLATGASARHANALADLDELAKTGAVNVQKLEQDIGESGPAARFLLELIRSIAGSASSLGR